MCRRNTSLIGKTVATASEPSLYQTLAGAGRYRSGQTGRTVNPLAYAFAGSNPALPTILISGNPGRQITAARGKRQAAFPL